MRRAWWRLISFIAIGLISRGAQAYRTAADLPEFASTARVRWARPVISYVVNSNVPSSAPAGDMIPVFKAALSAWEKVDCADIRFDGRGVTGAPARPGDGVNTIQWVSNDWAQIGTSADQAAITDVQYQKNQQGVWEIIEADIYLNAEKHSWVLSGTSADSRDLLSVLTHESGHMLGLMHPCEVPGGGGVPDCSRVQGAEETTMYPIYMSSQATLADDDREGACFLYPPSICSEGCALNERCTARGCQTLCENDVCDDDSQCDGEHCVPLIPPPQDAGASNAEILGASGDHCAKDADCESGLCADSVCTNACLADAHCQRGEHCVQIQSRSACIGLAPFGANCGVPEDCMGGECLLGASASPICTRACDSLAAPCPQGWECSPVEGRNVCAPKQNLAVQGGCSTSQRRAPDGGLSLLLAFGTAWTTRRVRRRNQSRRRTSRPKVGVAALTFYLALPMLGAVGSGCAKTETDGGGHSGPDSGNAGISSDTGGSSSSGALNLGGNHAGGRAASAGSSSDAGSPSAGSSTGPAETGLGSHCEMPGQLSCLGPRQKVSVICNASHIWEHSETCSGNLLCDSSPGPNLGSCQAPDPHCEGIEGGGQTCDGASLVKCNQAGTAFEKVSECALGCANAACIEAPGCPTSEYVNCASDCSGMARDCAPVGGCIALPYAAPIVRTPSAADACSFCQSQRRAFEIARVGPSTSTDDFMFKVEAGPWGLVPNEATACTATPVSCLVVSRSDEAVTVVTDNENAPPWNVTVEWVPKGTACPTGKN